MTRLAACGFESGAATEYGTAQAGTAPATQTTTVRSGVYALQCDGTAANASWLVGSATGTPGSVMNVTMATGTVYYYRVYIRVTALPSSSTRFMSYRAAAADTGCSIRLTSAGKLQVGSTVTGVFTQVGSDSAATLTTNTDYMVELAQSIGVGAVDYVEGRVDGVSIASTSTANITDTAAASFTIGWETAPGNTTSLIADDIVVSDNAASGTWPGDGKVVLLKPISDNARVGWTGGGGATTNLFGDVDNTPPAGALTAAAGTQIKDAVSNTTDHYDPNLTDYTTAGVGASDTINCVHIIANHARSTNAGVVHGFKMVSNPVIAEGTQAPQTAAAGAYPTNWKWFAKPGATAPSVTLGTSPVMSVRKSTTGSPGAVNSYVDFMGAYVDYTPAAAAVIPDVAMARVRT